MDRANELTAAISEIIQRPGDGDEQLVQEYWEKSHLKKLCTSGQATSVPTVPSPFVSKQKRAEIADAVQQVLPSRPTKWIKRLDVLTDLFWQKHLDAPTREEREELGMIYASLKLVRMVIVYGYDMPVPNGNRFVRMVAREMKTSFPGMFSNSAK